MRRKAILIVASSCAIALSVSLASAAVRTAFPAQNPGPPYYAFFAGAPFAEIFRDDGWVAIPFVRDPSCVPLGFNLLASADIPAAFGFELTVEGFALWKNGPLELIPCRCSPNTQAWAAYLCGSCAGQSCSRRSPEAC